MTVPWTDPRADDLPDHRLPRTRTRAEAEAQRLCDWCDAPATIVIDMGRDPVWYGRACAACDATYYPHGHRLDPRYADLPDRELAVELSFEDAAEAAGEIAPDERATCYTHRTWAQRCWHAPLHANPITGQNWCPECDRPAAGCPHRARFAPA